MQTKTFSKERKRYIGLMKTLMAVSAVLTCVLVAFLIIYVMYKGLPNLSWELLTTEPSYLADKIGIYPDILNTIYIVLATLVVVLPLGVGAAIYLTEYAQNKKLVAVIEYAAETLSGIPSIIYGLVGMLFFCQKLFFPFWIFHVMYHNALICQKHYHPHDFFKHFFKFFRLH
mgnify:CR=1 FL=1